VLLLSSRVSVEMVQKAACLGASILVAVSAPTALAVRAADAAGITLVAIARRDGFEIFTYPQRIVGADAVAVLAAPKPVSPRDWRPVSRAQQQPAHSSSAVPCSLVGSPSGRRAEDRGGSGWGWG